jgi:hypothetical protein
MVEQHPLTGIAHNSFYSFPVFRPITMDFAVGTGALVLSKRAI